MGALKKFFLNEDTKDDDAVAAPAFSLTKVLSAGAVIVAPLATYLVKVIEGDDFELQPGHVVALILGLLGFLAIVASADVIARAVATAAKTKAEGLSEAAQTRADAAAAWRDTENLIPFATALRATLKDDATDPEVTVLAAAGGTSAYYLVKKGDDLRWHPVEEVRILGPTR